MWWGLKLNEWASTMSVTSPPSMRMPEREAAAALQSEAFDLHATFGF